MKARLYYIYDPMCSWCWGYAPTWQRLQKELATEVEIIYQLGGLAKDSDELMPVAMQKFLQQTWRTIAQQLGTAFNFDFWQRCQPRRSTYPACRAALIARAEGKEQAMLAAIQEAYYLQAKNPSNIDTLHALALRLGLNGDDFMRQMTCPQLDQKLQREIAKVSAMPISGFPSLVLSKNHVYSPITLDYHNWRTSYQQIKAQI
ncbi:putative protein-disulfide isomerase [Colwellia chukchiensis]|uniref:DSBA-like thioredoxin domain-containing protein n=2 Tax=Colwellia chukchiensis TaxID=641665 RepID=A0A1H7GLV6_9GAMM|nr:putative protein-disulfide isomerase [Colwellia chukchiensis]